ncbi:RecQ mediated genome instability protein-like protein Rmi1 [Zopfia rhizophila CBS 207.26]|uniref:RecQ-mediated genome instability protein 1 n=1 Tax=Zopfia rhizophila CBS 207.26 TaxID=1314779 RepID=A0A6A6DGH1_9PEZI|nr:RecQ mediated genome instability protein-like protein Rmi1 [Zopfia rhizophila CBS 207.26]
MPSLSDDLKAHLNSRHLHPTPQWLASHLTTIRPNTPLPALKQTALFRLLASDITISLSPPPNTVFPADILNARIQSRHVAGPILCQVLDVEDIGHSRWSQAEAIEAKERGETTKGREIIRIVPVEAGADGEANVGASESKGPHKLLLQDAKGMKVYALELRGIEGVGVGMSIGAKLVLRDVGIARGVVMLEPRGVQMLGGKIEALDKAWKDGRKERLMATARSREGAAGREGGMGE